MKIKFLFFLCFSFLTNTSCFTQQLPYSSAFSDRGFIWNPAMTATWDYLEVGLNYRQQWLGFEQAPNTSSVSAQLPLVNNNMSLGAFYMNDQLGNFSTNTVALSYAYKFELGIRRGDQLSLGILGIANQHRYTSSNLILNDQDDNLISQGEGTKMIPNIGAGLYYCSSSGVDYDETYFFLGLGVSNILNKTLTFDNNSFSNFNQAIHSTGIIGARFVPGYQYFFEVSLLANHALEGTSHLSVNLKLEIIDSFWAGFIISSDSTIGFQGGAILESPSGGRIKIGGLGAYNLGKLGQYQGLGFEVFLAYEFLL